MTPVELNKYLIEFRNTKGGVILGYHRSLLHHVDIQCELSVMQLNWLWDKFLPFTESELENVRDPKIKITRMAKDLSFEAFWDRFAYKVGKKARAEKLWEALKEDERASALHAVDRYKQFIAHTNTAQAYAETWLAQRRWENEFKL